jgi:endonuclease YncB( thermonuclease family)
VKKDFIAVFAYATGLVEVFSDDKNINLEMIKAGLAEVYKGRPP